MEGMGWDQTKLGSILGISQQAAGKIVRGETKLKEKHVLPIHTESGYQIAWLLRGTGPMTDKPIEVNEPMPVELTRKQIDISPKGLQRRFTEAFEEYKELKNFTTYQETSEALHLNAEHVNNVRKGRKAVTITQLVNCVKYGQINANYILAAQQPVILRASSDSNREIQLLHKRIEELEKDKKMYQLLVESMTDEKKQTA